MAKPSLDSIPASLDSVMGPDGKGNYFGRIKAVHALGRTLSQDEIAALYHVPIERLSFKGSVDTLRQWSDTLNAAHDKPREQARLFNQLLQILAEDTVPLRPNRSEPRVRKRRPKAYPLMTHPRRDYRLTAVSQKELK